MPRTATTGGWALLDLWDVLVGEIGVMDRVGPPGVDRLHRGLRQVQGALRLRWLGWGRLRVLRHPEGRILGVARVMESDRGRSKFLICLNTQEKENLTGIQGIEPCSLDT